MRGQHSQEMCRRQGTVLGKEEDGRDFLGKEEAVYLLDCIEQ